MAEVSVIVPAYKVERYLPRCIESVLAQTFSDFELILIDDGSPDNCGAICDEYAGTDPRVRVIHKENGGVCTARNVGLDVASGRYIAFCDSDDYWSKDYLERLMAAMESSGADMVTANYSAVDDQGNVLWTSSHKTGTEIFAQEQARFDFLVCELQSGKYGRAVWIRLFKADIIREHNIRFCTTCENYAEDMVFLFHFCLYANKTYSIPDNIYNYYIRPDSMMQNSQGVVKLNQLNELSRFLYEPYCEVFSGTALKRKYPIIHFMLMCTEYMKIVCTPRYHTLSQEIAKIQNIKWYRRNIRAVWTFYPVLKRCFGKNSARRSLLMASYATHGSWKRFLIESAITYKWLVKGD